MYIWKVLVLGFSLHCTDYFIQFFPPKMISICFIFHLMNTQFFMSIALLHSVAEIIYIYKDRIMLTTRCVLKKRCSENMQQIYRRTPMPKCDFNKVALSHFGMGVLL